MANGMDKPLRMAGTRRVDAPMSAKEKPVKQTSYKGNTKALPRTPAMKMSNGKMVKPGRKNKAAGGMYGKP